MDILKSLNDIYVTLNKLDIKSTPNNVKLLTGVYMELERVLQKIGNDATKTNELEKVGGKNGERK